MKKILNVVAVLVLILVLLTSCQGLEPAPELAGFFEGYNWEELLLMLIAVVFFLFPGVKVLNIIKETFGVTDRAAHYLVIVVLMIITAFLMWVTGALKLASLAFTLKDILAVFAMVYTASQVGYKRLTAST